MGFSGEDIETLIEKKMECVLKKYDKKQLFWKQKKKIQILEKKCSGLVMVAGIYLYI